MQLVGVVSDIERALIYLKRQDVDVIVLDLYLQDRDGTHLLKVMHPWQERLLAEKAGPVVLFCTGQASADFAAQVRLLGAHGVVTKERMGQELLPAVRVVAAGETWFGSPPPSGPRTAPRDL